MKEAELKAFLAGKGIEVDDCPDINSLIDRAAATEEAWSAKSAAAPGPAAGPAPSGEAHLQIPCLLGSVEPCGDVAVPDGGMMLRTPAGEVWVRGRPACNAEEEEEAPDWAHWLFISLAVVGLTALAMLALPGQRHEWRRYAAIVAEGRVHRERAEAGPGSGAGFSDEDEEDEVRDALAAGGIYQALAVLHPGVIGYHRWSRCCARGVLCLVLQVYIPVRILSQVLSRWEYRGLKLPIWFLATAWEFAGMFVGLGMLYHLFAQGCIEHLLSGVEATSFVLSRRHIGIPETSSAPNGKEQPDRDRDFKGLVLLILEPAIEQGARANAFIWSCVSMTTSLFMAVVLQVILVVQIATFSGSVEHIVVVTVSLYFVLDVDRRILDADPRLKRTYCKHISTLETEGERASVRPSCAVRFAATLAAVLRCAAPLGLLAAGLTAWRARGSGRVVGGNPVCRPGW